MRNLKSSVKLLFIPLISFKCIFLLILCILTNNFNNYNTLNSLCMENMKSSNISKPGTFSTANIKRLPRESEPNHAIEGILNSVNKIKEGHQLRLAKKKREARLSEIEILQDSNADFISSRHKESKPSINKGFLSPTLNQQQRFLKKCTSASNICEDILSPKIPKVKENPPTQTKANKKQVKMDSLNLIEEMLSKHINLTNVNSPNKKIKPLRSPRFSQPALQEHELQFMNRKKEGESMGSPKKDQQKITKNVQLKDTVSTTSSHNSHDPKHLKITDFEFIKQLGRGKFGCVKLALHKKTNMIFSIKMIKKSVIKEENISEQLIKEIKVQSFLNHSHIVKLYSIFHDRLYVYLVLQACNQGNLYQLMQSKIKLSQDEGSMILKSVCGAIEELHHYEIIHRDLKPQNIVLCFGMPKICDFGWSTWLQGCMRQTFCGTPLYVSPELLSGHMYDQKVDLWALGILGYEMMTGSIPFKIKCQKDLCKIIESDIKYPRWMSNDTIDFLQSLLEKDPNSRKSLVILSGHPFLNRRKKQ